MKIEISPIALADIKAALLDASIYCDCNGCEEAAERYEQIRDQIDIIERDKDEITIC